MRLRLAFVCSIVLVSLVVGVPPARGQENLGLCDVDEDRRPESSITEDLWYCFDGEILHLRNESSLVFEVVGGQSPVRRLEGWSVPADEVLYGGQGGLSPEPTVPDNILPPGYSFKLQIGAQREDVEILVEPELSSTFTKEQLRTSLYGVVPGYGTLWSVVEAVHRYMDEMDESSINFSDCQQRARNFFDDASCNLLHKRDVTFAIGRGLVKGLPIVDDVPRVVHHIQVALKAANSVDEWAEVSVDPIADLGEWRDGQTVVVPGRKVAGYPEAEPTESESIVVRDVGPLIHPSEMCTYALTELLVAELDLARWDGNCDEAVVLYSTYWAAPVEDKSGSSAFLEVNGFWCWVDWVAYAQTLGGCERDEESFEVSLLPWELNWGFLGQESSRMCPEASPPAYVGRESIEALQGGSQALPDHGVQFAVGICQSEPPTLSFWLEVDGVSFSGDSVFCAGTLDDPIGDVGGYRSLPGAAGDTSSGLTIEAVSVGEHYGAWAYPFVWFDGNGIDIEAPLFYASRPEDLRSITSYGAVPDCSE